MLELVSNSSWSNRPDLLFWDGKKTTVGPRVEHNGRLYEGLELTHSLYNATRLPSGIANCSSSRTLFEAIRDLFKRHLDLPERESGLFAAFTISTWVADRLPIAPNMMIAGPDHELGFCVLRLLSCLCRRPLLLAEITPGSLKSLPGELSLTLLLDQQELEPKLMRILCVSKYRGVYLPGNRGTVINPYGPKAIFRGNDAPGDLDDGAIHVSVTPSQLEVSAFDELMQEEIANQFQPRLLMYRLNNLQKVCRYKMDGSGFTVATRPLARTLGMCFPDDLKLAQDTVQLLGPQDEELRGQMSRKVHYAITEVLWGLIHQAKKREVKVNELSKDVNALLQSRGETIEYSAEEIGWKLKSMNIRRHSDRSGRQVLFERETSEIVHRLARVYDIQNSLSVEACVDCRINKPSVSK